ncbi:MAG: M48 family metalloprotease [Gemmatimonadetes bacterium]|nr:M48 family metalloprotease [Gemmatimonadota bacterium]
MQNAGNDNPLEYERTPADGQDEQTRVDGLDRADPADPPNGQHQPAKAEQAVDDTIRLNWREKLVEGGLVMAMAMVGTLIGVLVAVTSLIAIRNTLEDLAPGLTEAGSIPFIILVVVAVAIGNVCSFSCAPYIIRLLYRGNELKDERMDRAVKHLISVTGMDIRAERIYAIKGKTANAVVAGLFRKGQYIFFTDKLLERMSEGEIMAALAHELAHGRHRHMTWMFLVLLLWTLVVQVFLSLIDYYAYFDSIGESWKMWVFSGINLVNIYLLMFLVLFPLSRRNEYQADATAALWVGTALYKQALYRLHQINDKLKPPRKFLAKLGTHPTLQERLERVGSLG